MPHLSADPHPPTVGRALIVAVVATYLVVLLAGPAVQPDYSSTGQFISELNASEAPYAAAIGWLGFFPFGVLSAALILTVSGRAPVQGASRIGVWFLLAEPIAYIGSVLAPCDAGCPATGSTSQWIHNVLGSTTGLVTTAGLVLLGTSSRLPLRWRVFWPALALLWITLLSAMLTEALSDVRGLLQRLAEGIVYGSLCIAAWQVLGDRERRGTPALPLARSRPPRDGSWMG